MLLDRRFPSLSGWDHLEESTAPRLAPRARRNCEVRGQPAKNLARRPAAHPPLDPRLGSLTSASCAVIAERSRVLRLGQRMRSRALNGRVRASADWRAHHLSAGLPVEIDLAVEVNLVGDETASQKAEAFPPDARVAEAPPARRDLEGEEGDLAEVARRRPVLASRCRRDPQGATAKDESERRCGRDHPAAPRDGDPTRVPGGLTTSEQQQRRKRTFLSRRTFIGTSTQSSGRIHPFVTLAASGAVALADVAATDLTLCPLLTKPTPPLLATD